jgi:hypothetical protein
VVIPKEQIYILLSNFLTITESPFRNRDTHDTDIHKFMLTVIIVMMLLFWLSDLLSGKIFEWF